MRIGGAIAETILGKGVSALRSAAGATGDMLTPPACIACGAAVARQGGLCAGCWREARFIDRPFCEVLGVPFAFDEGEGAVSPAAMAEPPPFGRLRAAMVYGDVARRLVSGLKFHDRPELGRWMAQLMLRAGAELLRDRPLVVPVPLHRLRLQQRRYNQSAELARALAAASGLVFAPHLLVRHRATRRQVGLGQSERERNVQGAFRVPPASRGDVLGARVLLIDDVYTSGATAKACARALKRGGAAQVDVLAFAMALDEAI
jgi:ComF family protein